MRQKSKWSTSVAVLHFVLALLIYPRVTLAVGAAQGSSTGDGSTPFTGLAQAPEANLFVGAATTSIPIEVPPGRRAITPKLALSYSSGGGASPYGYGWDLPLGRIQRSGKYGVPSCGAHINDYVLALPGANVECRLDAPLPANGPRECHPATIESYTKIQWISPNSWEVWDKSGTKYTFGSSKRLGTDAAPANQPFDASNGQCEFTGVWPLERIEDAVGNYLTIGYNEGLYSPSDGVLYPTTIKYGANSNVVGQSDSYKVTLSWIDRAPTDRLVNEIGGFPAVLHKLLDRIEVKYLGNPSADSASRLVRSYDFTYRFTGFPVEVADSDFVNIPPWIGHQSFLASVTLSDSNGQALKNSADQPVQTIFYYRNLYAQSSVGFAIEEQRPPKPNMRADPNQLRSSLPYSNGGTRVFRDVFDINGDGIADLVDTDVGCTDPNEPNYHLWRVYLGTKNGFETVSRDWSLGSPFTIDTNDADAHGFGGDTCTIRYSQRYEDRYNYWRDTFDITGDGIPDVVTNSNWSVNSQYWTVYRGRVNPITGGGEFLPGIPWKAPRWAIRRSKINFDYLGWTDGGTADVQDMIDFNGDGLPDYVDVEEAGGAANPGFLWSVWLNTGSSSTGPYDADGSDAPGFYSLQTFRAPYQYLRYTNVDNMQVLGLADINGDGLPDQIAAWDLVLDPDQNWGSPNFHYPGYWHVYLNDGRSMSYQASTSEFIDRKWHLPSSSCNESDRAWNGLRKSPRGYSHVVRDFFDINGDGLPDVVDSCGWSQGDPSWTVYLNQGADFALYPVKAHAPYNFIRYISQYGESTFYDVLDVDGDGLIDFVDFYNNGSASSDATIYRQPFAAFWPRSDGSATVAANQGSARPELLTMMSNGMGTITTLEYQPSTQWDNTTKENDSEIFGTPRLPFNLWTVNLITRLDTLTDPPASVHTNFNSIHYAGGRFDPGTREFRGFGTVEEFDSLGNRKATFYHQDRVLKGKIFSTQWFDGHSDLVLSEEDHTWQCAINGLSVTCPETVVPGETQFADPPIVVRLTKTEHKGMTDHRFASVTRVQTTAWDRCGNPTWVMKSALKAGTSTTPVVSQTIFSCPDSGDIAAPYILDKPRQNWVQQVDGKLLEEKWFGYDSKGNLLTESSWLDATVDSALQGSACPPGSHGSGGTCVTTTMEYDDIGNLWRVTDANNNATETTYDSATHIYPYVVVSSAGGLNHSVATGFEPGCGQKIWETRPYPSSQSPSVQPAKEWQYDTFCRLVRTALPDEDLDTSPHTIIDYALGAPGAPSITRTWKSEPSQTLGSALGAVPPAEPPLLGYVGAALIADGFGRIMQQRHEAVVDSAWTIVAEGSSTFDGNNQVARQFAPFASGTSLSSYAAPDPITTGFTEFQRDALGRVTRVINPDTTYRDIAHNVTWETTTYDECYTSNWCPGRKTIERTDGYGQMSERQVFEKDLAARESLLSRTGMTYDGAGRVTETRQGTTISTWDESTKIEIDYDSLGRKTRQVDPDSGTWLYGYDLVGNLVYQEDPKADQHIQFCYDGLNRLAGKVYVANDSFCPTACSSTCNGSVLNHSRYEYYDGSTDGFNFGGLHIVDDTSIGSQFGSTLFEYDVRGRTTLRGQMIYASDADSYGEVSTTYDPADRVRTITYPDGEQANYGYDQVGNVVALTGHQPSGFTAIYLNGVTYDVFGHATRVQHGNSTDDVLTFDGPESNYRLQGIQTRAQGQPRQHFEYSGYQANGLLTDVVEHLPEGALATLDSSYIADYDGMGRLTSVAGPNVGGAYHFDLLGNLTQKEGISLHYVTATQETPAKPHTLANMVVDQSTHLIGHDDNGNRNAKSSDGYEFDFNDRLTRITANGAVIEFVYNDVGERVAKVVNPGPYAQVTRYYGGLAEAQGPWLTKYYSAAGRMIASQRIWAPELASLSGIAPVQFAQIRPGALTWVVAVRNDLRFPFVLSAMLLGTTLLIAPWRRKRVVGIAVRQGHVILVLLAYSAASFPLPYMIAPAYGGGGGPSAPTATPTIPTPTGTPRTPTRTVTPMPTATPDPHAFNQVPRSACAPNESLITFALGICCTNTRGTSCEEPVRACSARPDVCTNSSYGACSGEDGTTGSDGTVSLTGTSYPPQGTAIRFGSDPDVIVKRSREGDSYSEAIGEVKFRFSDLPADSIMTRAFFSASIDPQATQSADNLSLVVDWVDGPTSVRIDDYQHAAGLGSALSTPISALAAAAGGTEGGVVTVELQHPNQVPRMGNSWVGLKFTTSQRTNDTPPIGINEVKFAAQENTTYRGPQLSYCYHGPGGTPTQTPTRTPTPTITTTPPGGVAGIQHYHLNHLGSVSAITDGGGNVVEYVRYKPYGEARHYTSGGSLISAAGANTCSDDGYCHLFTNYDSEPISGLQYAGARVYDPELGMFLTHDPARQFANPYTYTGWNPINLTDPSGAFIWWIPLVIGAIAGFSAAAAQTLIQGGSLLDAMTAGTIGGAIGAVGAYVGASLLQPSLSHMISAITSTAMDGATGETVSTAILLSSGAAQAGYDASRGNYGGVVGLGVGIGLGLAFAPLNDSAALGKPGSNDANGDLEKVSYKETPNEIAKPTYDAGPPSGELNGAVEIKMEVTGYCDSCVKVNGIPKSPTDPTYGMTASGLPTGPGTAAIDKSNLATRGVIRGLGVHYGDQFFVPGRGWTTVLDTGVGRWTTSVYNLDRLDVWFPTEAAAKGWGSRVLDVVWVPR